MKDIKVLHKEFITQARYAERLSIETIKGYQMVFDLLIKRFPELTAGDINIGLITEFFKWMDERERVVGKNQIKKGVKKSTIATYWGKLSKFFNWLVANEHMRENPLKSQKMKYPAVKYDDQKFLTKDKLDKIFTALHYGVDWKNSFLKKRNIAIFTTLFYSGLRRGELVGLKPMDLDFKNNRITVRPETSKSNRKRVIPLHIKVKEAVVDYLKEKKERGYKTEWLWASNNADRRFEKDGLKHLVELVSKKSGVKFHLHQFRHTCAINLLLSNNGNIIMVQQMLGHADLKMTATYLRAMPQSVMEECVAKLDLDKSL